MGSSAYEKHYLFKDGDDCCSRFFPSVSNCPFEDTPQNDYYWTSYQENLGNQEEMPVIYNHTYYPDINHYQCVNGTDYPSWMGSDIDYKRLYLFSTLEGCCDHWFASQSGCMNNVIQGVYEFMDPCPTNRPDCNNNSTAPTNVTEYNLGKWYPDIGSYRCLNDGKTPDWMLRESYVEWYLFNTREQCCSAFGYCWTVEMVIHISFSTYNICIY